LQTLRPPGCRSRQSVMAEDMAAYPNSYHCLLFARVESTLKDAIGQPRPYGGIDGLIILTHKNHLHILTPPLEEI
jgi:hypothetical protein